MIVMGICLFVIGGCIGFLISNHMAMRDLERIKTLLKEITK